MWAFGVFWSMPRMRMSSTLADDHSVSLTEATALPARKIALGSWTVTYDEGLAGQIAALRAERLPHETGGVLLGITGKPPLRSYRYGSAGAAGQFWQRHRL